MKRALRKPTLREKKFIDALRAKGGWDFYKEDWPKLEEMARDGLIEMSEPRGMGKAWRRVVIAGGRDW